MIGRDDLIWKDKELYQGNKKTGYSVVPDGGLGKFYKVKWPDGNLSEDYYNLTWGKENTIKAYLASVNSM